MVIACVSITAHAQGVPICTDTSRTCVIATATSYLNALQSHDASQVPLAPTAIRTENAVDTGDSGAQIANDLQTNPQYQLISGIRNVRWFVDGDNAIAMYLLDTAVPGTGVHAATAHLAERFQVQNGLITQIEAFYCTHPGVAPEAERTPASVAVFSEQCFGVPLPGT
jgi:hypothetical protein